MVQNDSLKTFSNSSFTFVQLPWPPAPLVWQQVIHCIHLLFPEPFPHINKWTFCQTWESVKRVSLLLSLFFFLSRSLSLESRHLDLLTWRCILQKNVLSFFRPWTNISRTTTNRVEESGICTIQMRDVDASINQMAQKPPEDLKGEEQAFFCWCLNKDILLYLVEGTTGFFPILWGGAS